MADAGKKSGQAGDTRYSDSEALLSCDILAEVHVRSFSQSGLTNEVGARRYNECDIILAEVPFGSLGILRTQIK